MVRSMSPAISEDIPAAVANGAPAATRHDLQLGRRLFHLLNGVLTATVTAANFALTSIESYQSALEKNRSNQRSDHSGGGKSRNLELENDIGTTMSTGSAKNTRIRAAKP